jgi:hypothetical protein
MMTPVSEADIRMLRAQFANSQHFPVGLFGKNGTATDEEKRGYGMAVTDVLTWLSANVTEITIRSDGEVTELSLILEDYR